MKKWNVVMIAAGLATDDISTLDKAYVAVEKSEVRGV